MTHCMTPTVLSEPVILGSDSLCVRNQEPVNQAKYLKVPIPRPCASGISSKPALHQRDNKSPTLSIK